jgi:lysophospholipase L1-like esterase
MRILLVGDSHTREMDTALKKYQSPCATYLVTVPSGLANIVNSYRHNLHSIINFDPSLIIIHAGHNDIVYHHYHNTQPTHPLLATQNILQFTQELTRNHPNARLAISSIYPRTYTSGSYLSNKLVSSYNQKAKRYGSNLKSITSTSPITCLLNNCLWLRISKSLEQSTCFDPDGLHLTPDAKDQIASEWLSVLKQPMT